MKKVLYNYLLIMFLALSFIILKPQITFAQSNYVELPSKSGISSSKVWTVNFNMPLNTGTVNNGNIRVVDSYNSPVAVKVIPGSDNKSALVIPSPGAYKPGYTYYLNIGGSLLSQSGKNMDTQTRMKFTIDSANAGLTEQEFIEKSKAIINIKAYDANRQLISTGKGFIISSDGQVVTKYGIINRASYVEVITNDNKVYEASGVLSRSLKDDLALLKLENAYFQNYVKVGDPNRIIENEQIIAITNPVNSKNEFLYGITSKVNNTSGDEYVLTAGIKTIEENEGIFINAKGEVIALISGASTNGKEENIGIHVSKVVSLLNSISFKTFEELINSTEPQIPDVPVSRGFSVVLDPGHGGSDNANKGPTGYEEGEGALDIALKANEILKAYPKIQVFMTRESDITLNAADRVKVSNSFGADILVAIHTNAGPSSADGAETYYSFKSPIGDKGHKLANLILQNTVNYTGADSRGAKTRKSTSNPSQDYYYMIRDTKPTAVILEAAFHTNPYEEQLLKTDEYRYRIALGIAKGIVEYYGLDWIEPKSQYTDGTVKYKVFVDGKQRVEFITKENALNLASLSYQQSYSTKVTVVSSNGETIFSKDKSTITR